MPKITEFDRHKILILHQQGHSQREISNKLDKQELVFKTFEECLEEEELEGQENFKNLKISFSVYSLRGWKRPSKDLAEHLAASLRCQVDPCTV